MKHPYKKFFQLQLLMMGLALLLGVIALVKASLIMIIAAFYFLAFSFIFEGLAEHKKQHTLPFAQQIARAFFIIILISYLAIILI
ncbi:hypothetical protein [Sediminibacillus halophilus]|uniref:Uncharacterized protein n=1 Tax=Sediminibacillus halophilus TaxID=482461 RepID=A0A1G9TW40_9BACI|nr:hypothetical protein [Sediminibacillus halophilus]SDM51624.1 hypothetical protein SAMN05216244_2748 [Sediminibacillus halophilus]